MTVLDYYSARHPHFSRGEWRQRIDAGLVTRAAIPLATNDKLREHDVLHYFRAPWSEPDVQTDIPILKRDEHVIVFDKPDQMPVLAGGAYLEHSMVMIVRRVHDAALSPLHRLGRGTTGAILFTRSHDSAEAFSRLMRMRKIGKIYLALVHGVDMPDEFTISTPIGRVQHSQLGDIHDVSPQGKEAVSKCTVLARNPDSDTALIRVSILTGRTHQIRIHLASEGHPLVGDRFYRGRRNASEDTDEHSGRVSPSDPSSIVLPSDPGYILHSWKLQYRDPFTDRDVEVVAPVRREIVEWCESVGYATEDSDN
ncbi:MAG TPA: RluA family pseudouridine synthase [Bacteroidota bacterium]|nr:RluA family pseudouridine synthase [Bacteroidota bacterium]